MIRIILPRTSPLPAPIAAPPIARSREGFPVLKKRGLAGTERGEERRISKKKVQNFMMF